MKGKQLPSFLSILILINNTPGFLILYDSNAPDSTLAKECSQQGGFAKVRAEHSPISSPFCLYSPLPSVISLLSAPAHKAIHEPVIAVLAHYAEVRMPRQVFQDRESTA